jgi:hypothetical protein
MAILVFILAALLLIVAVARALFFEGPLNPYYMGMLAFFGLLYFSLMMMSSVEVDISVRGDILLVVVQERVRRPIRERKHRVERGDMRKVKEIDLWGMSTTVRVEGDSGRLLAVFPMFMPRQQHDEMIAAILEWGDRP